MAEIKKLAVLTSGGDSPAMNAAVYGFASAAADKGIEVYGVIDGYKGLIHGNYRKIDLREFKKTIFSAGTDIGSSRCLEFKEAKVRQEAVDLFKKNNFDGLFVIGGDGSYMGASLISEIGCPVVVAPGTIDNDVASSKYTIGYFSALEEIFQAVKKIKATSESHSQVTFVEVMGRHCHDLSVAAAVAGAVDYVVTNASIKTEQELATIIKDMIVAGKKGIVILVTEKVYGVEHGFELPSLRDLCVFLERAVGRQVRYSVLGYTQRGATPTSWDLYAAQRFGLTAFQLAYEGKWGNAVCFDGHDFGVVPLKEAVAMPKHVSNKLIDFVNAAYKI
ncbi:ATP-dependent 6-phosphofructokinase [Candidatus Mycoplasma haematohominis]|uniref:ATP-dependent 6-phosphofructokinase n=1 Tax=Candidatus Mycoplasma haematohominis TaxID=1494318 RepID=UPI001FEA1B76|nr:ATP-dependent 6-phosphofructokinase [Candidatus Mycoplasma haemohominis]